MASPRAVSIRIGVWRARADAAADLEPVHVRQHQVEDDRIERLARGHRDAGLAASGDAHAKSGLAEIAFHHLGEARIVFDQQDAVGHRAIVERISLVIAALELRHPARGRRGQKPERSGPAPGMSGAARQSSAAMPACASAVDPLGDLPALLRRQHAGGIGKRLRTRRVAWSASAIWSVRRVSIAARSMVVCVSNSRPRWREAHRLFTQRQEIAHRRADDAAQALLLLRCRVHLDREMAHHPVGAILDGGRIERLAPARAATAGRSLG